MCLGNDTSHGGRGDFFARKRAPSTMQSFSKKQLCRFFDTLRRGPDDVRAPPFFGVIRQSPPAQRQSWRCPCGDCISRCRCPGRGGRGYPPGKQDQIAALPAVGREAEPGTLLVLHGIAAAVQHLIPLIEQIAAVIIHYQIAVILRQGGHLRAQGIGAGDIRPLGRAEQQPQQHQIGQQGGGQHGQERGGHAARSVHGALLSRMPVGSSPT